jgi:archaetidylinositol phosphate synthase
MLENTKEFTRDALKPLARNLKGINPNTLTLLGLLASLASAVFFAKGEVLIAGCVLLVSGIFDALDGAVAREHNRITRFGGFLDSVSDRFADAAIIFGAILGGLTAFSNYPSIPGWSIGVLAIVGSLMVSYTRARAEAAGATASVGIGERAVRIMIIVLGAFSGLVNWAILIVAILSFITVIQRIVFVRDILK